MLEKPLNTVCFCVRMRSPPGGGIVKNIQGRIRWFEQALPRLIPALRFLAIATEQEAYTWRRVVHAGGQQAVTPLSADEGERVVEYLSDPMNGVAPRFEGGFSTAKFATLFELMLRPEAEVFAS